MKYHSCRLIIFLFVVQNFINLFQAIGQNKETLDSLQQQLSQTNLDTNRIHLFNELAWVLRESNYKSALSYAQQAESLAQRSNHLSGLATSYVRSGTIYKNQGVHEKALIYFNKALKLEEKINHSYGIARAKNQIALIYIDQNNLDDAIIHLEAALRTFRELHHKTGIALALHNLGLCYRRLGNTTEALEYYVQSLKVKEKLGTKKGTALSHGEIGSLYYDNKDYSKALIHYNKALEINKELGFEHSIATNYYHIGLIYQRIDNYDEAIIYLKKSLELKEKLGTQKKLAALLNAIGLTFYYQKKRQKAIIYFERSVKIALKNKEKSSLSRSYQNIGLVLRSQEKYKEALDYFFKSLDLARESQDSFQRYQVLKNIAITYARLGNYQKAYDYNKKHTELNDSLETSYRSSTTLIEEYQRDRHQYELQNIQEQYQAALESRRKTLIIYILLSGVLVLSLLFFFILRAYRVRQEALLSEKKLNQKEQEVEKLLREQEVKSMTAMMQGQEDERNRIAQDLHDRLGGLLYTIKLNFQAIDEQINELKIRNRDQYFQATKLLDHASQEVRKIAHDMYSGILRNFGLVAAVEDMLNAIQKTGALDVNLIVTGFDKERLEASLEVTIYRVIQELVGNVLKHAEATELEIQLFRRKDGVNLVVEDDGRGFEPDNLGEKVGMGLKSIESRVKSFNGELNIDSRISKGTIILIDIPID